MRKRPAPEVVASVVSAVEPEPKRSAPSATEASPVPPPAVLRSPASVFANVHVSVTQVIVVDAVSPLNAVDEVAMRSEPVSCWPTPPSASTPVFVTLPAA